MKKKALYFLSTAAITPVMMAGLMFTTGCESIEDDPMPPGAYQPENQVDAPRTDVDLRTDGTPATPSEDFKLKPDIDVVVPPLNIPSDNDLATPPQTPAPELIKYKVQKGDTLSHIAKRYGVTVTDLAAYNQITRKNFIRVGQTITIPPGGVAPKASAVSHKSGDKKTVASGKKAAVKNVSGSKAPAAPKKKNAVQAIPADGIYVVQKNDSFYKIAAKFGVKAADIAAANNLSLDKMLQIGQKLNIPKQGSSVAVKNIDSEKSVAPVDPKSEDKTVAPVGELPNTDLILDNIPNPEDTPATPIATESTVNDTITSSAIPDAELAPTASGAQSITLSEDGTLDQIATKFMVKVDDIKKLNPQLSPTEVIKAGTSIKLP